MAAAKVLPADKAAITSYVAAALKKAIKRQAFERDLNVSAIVEALLEQHLAAGPDQQAPIFARAEAIAEERRRRAE